MIMIFLSLARYLHIQRDRWQTRKRTNGTDFLGEEGRPGGLVFAGATRVMFELLFFMGRFCCDPRPTLDGGWRNQYAHDAHTFSEPGATVVGRKDDFLLTREMRSRVAAMRSDFVFFFSRNDCPAKQATATTTATTTSLLLPLARSARSPLPRFLVKLFSFPSFVIFPSATDSVSRSQTTPTTTPLLPLLHFFRTHLVEPSCSE